MASRTVKKRSVAARKAVAKAAPGSAKAGAILVTDKRGRTARAAAPSERSKAAIAAIARTRSQALKRLAKK